MPPGPQSGSPERHRCPGRRRPRPALKRFGNAIRHREDARAAHGLVWWDHITHDLRHAGRAIPQAPRGDRRDVALGIGIGGPAAVLSVMLSTSVLVSPASTALTSS